MVEAHQELILSANNSYSWLILSYGSGIQASHGISVNSDDRIKTSEVFIENATETLNKLRPQVYDKWSSLDFATNSNAVSNREAGLIAQEIFYDAPELRHLVNVPETANSNVYSSNIQSSTDPSIDPDYSDWGTTTAGVNYTGLIPYLIKALQEKDADIRALEARMTAAGI